MKRHIRLTVRNHLDEKVLQVPERFYTLLLDDILGKRELTKTAFIGALTVETKQSKDQMKRRRKDEKEETKEKKPEASENKPEATEKKPENKDKKPEPRDDNNPTPRRPIIEGQEATKFFEAIRLYIGNIWNYLFANYFR